ncbi:hypothetical protein SPBRAN_1299 [uncultured Candidatus Thioglobus sp.]|nr:hypothetical protein SPBRAN_1299 [uncultured Candidatus Thioglobus sp.]
MSINEVCSSISQLSNDDKYTLLNHHMHPPNVLRSTFSYGSNRKFSLSWLQKYPWLRYSPKLDAVLCGPCALLLPSHKKEDKGFLVNKPFSNWVKISNALSNHSKLQYHHECLQDADILKYTIENPVSRIDVMTNTTLQAQNE